MSLDRLAKSLGPDVVVVAEEERRKRALDLWPQALGWSRELVDARVPPAVLLPRTEAEASACLEWAASEGASLVLRGGGSGVVGAAIPEPGAFVLDTSALRWTPEVLGSREPTLRVAAGWRGGDLERWLNTRGRSLRHFPQSHEDASVGGWIAHDGFGQLSTRYGGIRRQLLSLKVLGAKGVATEQAPDAQLGAEGLRGLIVEATLLIRQAPSSRRFFSWSFGGLDEAAAFARVLAGAKPAPSVLRALGPVDRLVHTFGHGSGGGGLLSKLEKALLERTHWLHAAASLAGRRWTLLAAYEDEPPFGPAVARETGMVRPGSEGPAKAWWERRFKPDGSRLRGVFAKGCFADTADLWAPYAKLAAVERDAGEAAKPHAFAYSHLSHFDGEGACVYVTLAGVGGGERHAAAWRAVMDACVRAGGRVNHHHGIGRAKAEWRSHAVREPAAGGARPA